MENKLSKEVWIKSENGKGTDFVKLDKIGVPIHAGKYFGSFDDFGLEGLLPYKDNTKEEMIKTNAYIKMTRIRASSNGHRNQFAFICVLDKKEAESIFGALDKGEYLEAKEFLGEIIKLEVL